MDAMKQKIVCTACDKDGGVVVKHEWPSNPQTLRGANRTLKQRLKTFEMYYRPFHPSAIEFEAHWE